MREIVVCWIICLVLVGLPSQAQDTYKVILDDKQGLISVRACFADIPPSYLSTGRRSSSEYLIPEVKKRIRMSRNGTRMYLADKCIAYQVDLNLAIPDRQARNRGNHWLVNNRAWLWRPATPQDLRLEFYDKNNQLTNVSVPWPEQNGGYVAGNTPLGWTSRMLFGGVEVSPLALGGIHLNLAQTTDIPDRKRAEIRDWVLEAAGSVAMITGQFPVDQAQILVIPIGKRKEAVPWAEVQRAGRPAVHLFIDPNRPISEFKADWTAVHELSHLLVPLIEYNDRWLSEGLASYYQNVAKARAGLLTGEQAWQKLQAGFAKGRRAYGGSLRESKRTKHVYWGGAAIYLLADVRLRDLPNPQSLDLVLAKLQACCLPSDKMWSANDLMKKLDELSQTDIFSRLLANEAVAPQFPISRSDEQNKNTAIARHLDAVFKLETDARLARQHPSTSGQSAQ